MFRAISRTEKEMNSMDVLIVEPEKVPRMADITGDLNSLKQVVGGYIEAVYPFDNPVAIRFATKKASSSVFC